MEVIDGSDPSKLPGIVWTRELLLQRAGFEPVTDLRRALNRTRRALNATTPVKTFTRGEVKWTEGGEPDHAIRLKAAEHVYDLADVRKRREGEVGDASRPIAVNIILTGRDGTQRAGSDVQGNGFRLHLTGGERGEA